MLTPITGQDICRNALMEIGALAQGEAISPGDAEFTLRKLNRILDNWNAERSAVYATRFDRFTLTPNLNPHTIGPTGTWVMAQRPIEIVGASLILEGALDIFNHIAIRDVQWWEGLTTPDLATDFPTDLWYNPEWPNGQLYFSSVPTIAREVDLQSRMVLAEVALDTSVTLPNGYEDALTLTLAEECAPGFGKAVDPRTTQSAMQARARVWVVNETTPRIMTVSSGMPGGQGGYFNWRTGQIF